MATFFTSASRLPRVFALPLRNSCKRPVPTVFNFIRCNSHPSTASETLRCLKFNSNPYPHMKHSTSSSAVTYPSKIFQFVKSDIWQATHKTARSRKSFGPPFGRPPSPFRRFIDSIPSEIILWGILVLNGIVFGLWQLAEASSKSGDRNSWWVWMHKNFLVSMYNIREGRLWTIVTSMFSHSEMGHFFFNGLSYYFMAPTVLSILGNTSFLALYFGGGLVSTMASLYWFEKVKHKNHFSHGASGAIYSIISYFACVAPTASFLIFYVIPCPAWAFVTGIFLFDGWSAINDKRGKTDTPAHIGGLLAGIGYYVLRRRMIGY